MTLAAVLLLMATGACPAGETRTAQALRAAEADWVAALEQRDVARLACRLADNFIDTTWQGRRAERAAVLTALPHRPGSTLELTLDDVQVDGDFGLVRGVNTQRGSDGRTVGSVRFTDIFRYRNGRWQAVSAQETAIVDHAD